MPRKHGQWRVDVGPFQVLVTGTRFDVEWDPGQERFTLALHEGLDRRWDRWWARVGRSTPARRSRPSAKRSESRSPMMLAPTTTPSPSGSTAAPLGEAPPATDQGAVVESEGSSATPLQANALQPWRELAAAGKYRKALEVAERAGFEKECERSSAEDLAALGDAARFAGQPARAVQALQALRKRFPADPRASAAAFELGRVAFDQQGSFGEAAKWFAIYLRERPHGSLAREASGRLVESLSKAGDRAGARDAATKYLARYRSGPHSELARSLVGRKCLVVLAIAAALLATPSAAHATAPRIAIVTDRPDDALPALIDAELEVLGFDVVMVTSKEPAATEPGSITFPARLVPTHSGVEVWLIDPGASELTMRELVRTDGASPSTVRIAAVRAVELLRARLAAPHPEATEVPDPAADQVRPRVAQREGHGGARRSEGTPRYIRFLLGLIGHREPGRAVCRLGSISSLGCAGCGRALGRGDHRGVSGFERPRGGQRRKGHGRSDARGSFARLVAAPRARGGNPTWEWLSRVRSSG